MAVKVAVIYYSATGTTYALAKAIAEGAEQAGAEVRVRKVRELAPEEAIASNAGWAAHRLETQDVPEATLADLEECDALIFGSPTRYGLPSAQLKQFIDTTGPLWGAGKLVNKVTSAFTTVATAHGGHEATLLSLYTIFFAWSAIPVAPGYADPIQFASGNPYGTSFASQNGALKPDDTALAAARFQGKRVAEIAARLAPAMAGVGEGATPDEAGASGSQGGQQGGGAA